jgi:hypothetical protein
MQHDGRFYLYIASDPMNAWAKVDYPAQRYQRILYPMLARLLTLGSESLLPWVLLGINLAAVTAAAALLAQLAVYRSAGLWPLLAFSFWVGHSFSIAFDLAEPLCFALIILALYLYEREHTLWAALACALAALTKEVTLAFVAGFVGHLVLQKHLRRAGQFALLSVLPFAGLQAWLKMRFGAFGFQTPSANFEWVPFAGIVPAKTIGLLLTVLFLVLPNTVVTLGVLWDLVRRRKLGLYALFVILNALLMVTMPRLSYADFMSVARVLTGSVLASLLWVSAVRSRRTVRILSSFWLFINLVGFFLCFSS